MCSYMLFDVNLIVLILIHLFTLKSCFIYIFFSFLSLYFLLLLNSWILFIILSFKHASMQCCNSAFIYTNV